jgi:molybdopterin converting factor small subunit
MMPRLLLFGQLRDYAATLHGADVELPAASVADVLMWLEHNHPELGQALKRPGVRFAVDHCFADAGTAVSPDSEIALMSPLSGG